MFDRVRRKIGWKKDRPAEVHHTVFLSCMNLTKKATSPFCGAALGIALDMGPVGFVCPNCGAVYLVDPIKQEEGVPYAEEFMFFEVEGHRIEAFYGQAREKVLRNPSAKLGKGGKVFMTPMY